MANGTLRIGLAAVPNAPTVEERLATAERVLAEAAARETLEEACARVKIGEMFTFINVPHINQVHILYRARLLDLDFAPGTESLEVQLFEEAAIPWKEIAFRTIGLTLQHYFEDRKAGSYGFHARDLLFSPK